MKLILASGSPRRKELINLITGDFEIVIPDVDESFDIGITALDAVLYLSGLKAYEVFRQNPDAAVIGADTVVEQDGVILGKPLDKADALRMLGLLSGKSHRVHTGVTVLHPGGRRQFTASTIVTFSPMSDDEIDGYVATGEPMDKAGAYGIQGLGGVYIPRIEGDYYNVMGLPINSLYYLLKEEKIL